MGGWVAGWGQRGHPPRNPAFQEGYPLSLRGGGGYIGIYIKLFRGMLKVFGGMFVYFEGMLGFSRGCVSAFLGTAR